MGGNIRLNQPILFFSLKNRLIIKTKFYKRKIEEIVSTQVSDFKVFSFCISSTFLFEISLSLSLILFPLSVPFFLFTFFLSTKLTQQIDTNHKIFFYKDKKYRKYLFIFCLFFFMENYCYSCLLKQMTNIYFQNFLVKRKVPKMVNKNQIGL